MGGTWDLIRLLVSLGWLDEDLAQSVRWQAAEEGTPPIQVLRRGGHVTDAQLVEALRGHLGIHDVDPTGDQEVELDALRWLPRELAEAHLVLPLGVYHEGEAATLRLAMADPLHEPSRRAAEGACGLSVEPVLADAGKLEQAIATSYGRITTRLIPRPERIAVSERTDASRRRRWPERSTFEPETEPSHRMEDEASPLQQVEALRLLLERKGLISREEFVEVLKALMREGEEP